MSKIILETSQPTEFESIYQIMTQAFPPYELRTKEGQRKLLEKEEYNIYTCKKDGKIIGFIAGWKVEGMDFVEHFAVDERYRGNGLGAEIMNEFLEKIATGIVVLEVELPETKIAERRIGFYKRLGFKYNEFPYTQPSMQPGQKAIPLKIMSYPDYISKEVFDDSIVKIRNHVYNQK